MLNTDLIGERIKAERKRQNWTQKQLAEKIKTYSEKTLRDWEKGNTNISVDGLIELSNLFGCDVNYLIGTYDYRTKESEDICKTTGLSEEAVKVLVKLKKHREHSFPSYHETLSAEKLKFISYLIENEDKFTSAVMDTLSHLNSDLNSKEYRAVVDFFSKYNYWSEEEFMKMQEFSIYDTYLELVKSYLKDKELQRDTK